MMLTLFPREIDHPFIFDTGCEITMVSEDVAGALGLPDGGRVVNVKGSVGHGKGRLVEVRFRFPRSANGKLGVECMSNWVVVSGARKIALLGFQEVHKHFCIRTLEFDVYFILWSTLRGK
jgi:hypothetical protein